MKCKARCIRQAQTNQGYCLPCLHYWVKARMPNRYIKFTDQVIKTDTCWLWTGAMTGNGYGLFLDERGTVVMAHRASYSHYKNKIIGDRLTLDHLCRVRHCVNPDHLEEVTQAENNRRKDEHHGKRSME